MNFGTKRSIGVILAKNIEIRNYDYIDSLRGFAILGVVAVHVSHWVHPSLPLLDVIAQQGAKGVQLFFMVSALTLFLSLDYRRNKEGRPVSGFFIRRFFRIAPMFYLAIIVYSSSIWTEAPPDWWKILLTLTFTHGWHPESINEVVPGGWTIAVEMTFYLFVPLLFTKLKDFRSTLILLLLTLFMAKAMYLIGSFQLSPFYPENQQKLLSSFLFYWFFSQAPVFILGILVYHTIKMFPTADKTTALLLLVISLFLFAAFLMANTFFNLLPNHFLFGLGFFFFILSLHYYPNKVFVNQMTVLIGKISFSTYLIHFMVIMLFKRQFAEGFPLAGNTGFLVVYIMVLMLSCCSAYLTYRCVEVPGMAVGKKIIRRYF